MEKRGFHLECNGLGYLPEFKARYLKKQMDLMVAVNVLTFDIKGAGRKGITLRLYIWKDICAP